MSLERIFRWTCDHCQGVSEKPTYGAPAGWHWMQSEGRIKHACEYCSERLLTLGMAVSKTDPNQLVKAP